MELRKDYILDRWIIISETAARFYRGELNDS